MLRILNTIPGFLLFLLLTSTFIQKAEANHWWNWNQPSISEEKCQAYVKGKLSNHSSKTIRANRNILSSKITDLIKERNSGRLSTKEAGILYIQSQLQPAFQQFNVKESTAKIIVESISSEMEIARSQSDCSQIK